MKRILCIAVFVVTGTVFSQEAMTFQNCLERALQNNLDLKSAYLKKENAAYQYKASYGKILPNISGEIYNRDYWGQKYDKNVKDYVPDDVKNYRGTLDATFNLFSGFSVINNIKANKQDMKISEVNIQKVTNALTIDLAEKFITILYLQEIVTANQEQITSSEKQLELANLKFDSGVISESEVFKVKSQKATEELTLLNNQNHLSDNLISLKQLMNMPLETEITLLKPELKLDSNAMLNENQYTLADKAVNINPTYSISLLREKKERAVLAVARASRYPELTMRTFLRSNYTDDPLLDVYDKQVDKNFQQAVRLTLKIPIFNQFSDFAKIKNAKTNLKQAKLDTEMTRNQLSKEVLKAITDTKTSIKKNESSTIAFDFSKKSFEADGLKFEMGKININELNNSKVMFNNSQAELIQSKYELLFNNALIKFYLGETFSL